MIFFAFSGVSDYGYWHLSRRRGRNKETQKASDILNFVSLSSSIWERDHSDAIPPVELTGSLFVMAFHEKIVAY